MTLPTRLSYGFIVLLLIAADYLHIATPLVTVLFCYFALDKLGVGDRKWLGVSVFLILLSAAGVGFSFFIKQALVALPRMAETTIPVVLGWAEKQGIELPFADYQSLRLLALNAVKGELGGLGKYAGTAVVQTAAVIIGIVVAISLFLNPKFDLEANLPHHDNNLYTLTGEEVGQRFRTLYRSFATVMGAQIIISAINTTVTALFLYLAGFPNAPVIIGTTFLCGLIPIIGNLISNTIIVGVGFTIAPQLALMALIFLIVLHKFEYFLNSKIVGDRIQNPMWLTLIGLVIGEKLMGIPGMILAPVMLHYIKVEAKGNQPLIALPDDPQPSTLV
ncbi:MAG: AI-2E family transporter [Gemmatimonadota bacterium]